MTISGKATREGRREADRGQLREVASYCDSTAITAIVATMATKATNSQPTKSICPLLLCRSTIETPTPFQDGIQANYHDSESQGFIFKLWGSPPTAAGELGGRSRRA
jgi:hypothetical protein